VDCGNSNTSTDNTQPVTQNKSTTQLAETGSDGTTFMIIGAATLIAGGVAFRLTPRLANRRTAA
jgi:LPXTG-motif cell wall-anchored protein